jgi:N-acetylglutamate synthase and related acetyltransferases
MIVREATRQDIPGIVEVHREAFKGFLMTRLGERFLRTYYGIALGYAGVIALVVCDPSGKVAGFVVGYDKPKDFYTYFSAKKWEIVRSMALSLLRNPFLLSRVMASKKQAENSARNEAYADGVVELASVAVSPEFEGKGLGGKLVDGFIDKARGCGAKEIFLTTDLMDNDQTLRFYERNGFKVVEDFKTSSGRLMRQTVFACQQ